MNYRIRFLFALLLSFLFGIFTHAQQLVLPGAYPDPSVVKIGDTYWASATTSNWFPAFPLLHSKDLITWQQEGYIFNKPPTWADYYFWAPEINYDSGKVYVYYTAHKKNGSLCVAVASADKPEGPYTDHGPLVCEQYGSIDAFSIRDTSGKLFLIWKEDANSVNQPTPIWASEMNEERTALIGEKSELFRNDARWEKELVEGVSMIRHGQYYYAFYAAAGCCGSRCTYVSGVARARDVLGPWEKYNRNPVLVDSGNWICKGHGTPIEKEGKFYFLYHGYDKVTSAFTGREGLLQEFRFTLDDWIEFVSAPADSIQRNEIVRDEFDDNKLSQSWQWSVFDEIKYELKKGRLSLFALPGKTGSFMGQKIESSDYTASTSVDAVNSNSFAGLAAIGDEKNMLAVVIKNYQLYLLKVADGKDSMVAMTRIPAIEKVYLQMRVQGRYQVSFFYSFNGKNFIALNKKNLRGVFLPPWDSPPRAGLISKGSPNEKAIFDQFEIRAGISNSSDITLKSTLQSAVEIALYLFALAGIVWVAIYFYKKQSRKRKALIIKQKLEENQV